MKQINNIILVLIAIVIIHFIVELHKERDYKKKQEEYQNQINNSTTEFFTLKSRTDALKDLYGNLFIIGDNGETKPYNGDTGKESRNQDIENEALNNQANDNAEKPLCHPDEKPDSQKSSSTRCDFKNKNFLGSLTANELREMQGRLSNKLESESNEHHNQHHENKKNHNHKTCKCGCNSDTCNCENGGCKSNNDGSFRITDPELLNKLKTYNALLAGKNKQIYY